MFAAVSVVLCHTVGVSNLVSTTSGAYLAALRAGVEVLFVISGFALYRPFAKATAARNGTESRRILPPTVLADFPAYWLVLTIGFAFGVTFLAGIALTVSTTCWSRRMSTSRVSWLVWIRHGPLWWR